MYVRMYTASCCDSRTTPSTTTYRAPSGSTLRYCTPRHATYRRALAVGAMIHVATSFLALMHSSIDRITCTSRPSLPIRRPSRSCNSSQPRPAFSSTRRLECGARETKGNPFAVVLENASSPRCPPSITKIPSKQPHRRVPNQS